MLWCQEVELINIHQINHPFCAAWVRLSDHFRSFDRKIAFWNANHADEWRCWVGQNGKRWEDECTHGNRMHASVTSHVKVLPLKASRKLRNLNFGLTLHGELNRSLLIQSFLSVLQYCVFDQIISWLQFHTSSRWSCNRCAISLCTQDWKFNEFSKRLGKHLQSNCRSAKYQHHYEWQITINASKKFVSDAAPVNCPN